MSFNPDSRTPAQQVGRVLLKQKSRRLLDSVLRRRMLVDAMKGYGDELRYNAACRTPNYRPKELSEALDRLKFIRQKLLTVGKPVPDGLVIFQRFSSSTPSSALSQDRNANYLSTSFVINSGSSKPPIFVVPAPPVKPTQSTIIRPTAKPSIEHKNSARNAISSALSQSMNFKKFKQENGDSTAARVGGPSAARVVPITVKTKSQTTKNEAQKKMQAKCKTSFYLPMTNGENHSSSGRPGLPSRKSAPTTEIKVNEAQNSSIKAKSLTEVEDRDKPNAVTSNGGPPSKFRIKKISIAGIPAKKTNDDDRQGRNYVTGIKLHKPSPPAKITIDLKASDRFQQSAQSTKPQNDNAVYTSRRQAPASQRMQGTDTHFIKGMTFSAREDQQQTKQNPCGLQNSPRILSYDNRARNKFSHPQGDATRRAETGLRNGAPNHVNEDLKEEIALPKADTKKEEIPRFYFPQGKPRPKDEVEIAIQRISKVCSCFENRVVPIEEMGRIVKAFNLSLYWKGPLFHASTEHQEATEVSESSLIKTWKKITASHHDASARFVALLAKPGKNCLDFEDFLPLLKDIVDTHPGLVFLKDAPEFHTRYMNTVIARIFYVINRSWSGQITASELRKSNFLTVLSLLEEEEDINAITDYFSYEHFYVIYCKFWELDADHDLVIDKHDLIGYGDGVLSSRLIDRVLSGAVTRWDTSDHHLGRMSYVDFVWFILSEEDKKTPTSIEYWYRCMDLDGDGFISMYEMEYFYEEQSQKLEQLDIEPLPFEDCVCQIFDIVNPKYPGKVSLNDLKKCKMAHVFFDTFFNVAKYLNNEQKDPFMAQNGSDGTLITVSDWDNFAAEEYEMLVAEEQSNKFSEISKALLDEGDAIDILDERAIEDSHQTLNNEIVALKSGKREEDIAAEFTELNFIDNAESMVPLAQT